MDELILDDAEAVAQRAVTLIASLARDAIVARQRFIFACSGGHTPWRMLQLLALEPLDWQHIHIVQVDERVAPEGDPDRNIVHLRESLANAPLDASHIHAMPVESADLDLACQGYSATLQALAGKPPILDLVHLGLGVDGHTASLVPGDAVLLVNDKDVALTAPYMGRIRMTLTYPVINRARQILMLVTGSEKRLALEQLQTGDPTAPACGVRREHATLIADRASLGGH